MIKEKHSLLEIGITTMRKAKLDKLEQEALELFDQLDMIEEKRSRMHTDITAQQYMSFRIMLSYLNERMQEIEDEKIPVYQKISELAKTMYELSNPEHVFELGQTGYVYYRDICEAQWPESIKNINILIKILELNYDLIRLNENEVEPRCVAKVSYQTIGGLGVSVCEVDKIRKGIIGANPDTTTEEFKLIEGLKEQCRLQSELMKLEPQVKSLSESVYKKLPSSHSYVVGQEVYIDGSKLYDRLEDSYVWSNDVLPRVNGRGLTKAKITAFNYLPTLETDGSVNIECTVNLEYEAGSSGVFGTLHYESLSAIVSTVRTDDWREV